MQSPKKPKVGELAGNVLYEDLGEEVLPDGPEPRGHKDLGRYFLHRGRGLNGISVNQQSGDVSGVMRTEKRSLVFAE